MRRTRRENFLRDHLIYVIIGILAIVLIVLILGKVFGNSDEKEGTNNSQDSSMDIAEVKKELKKDTTPELTELIQQYYTAMSASDVTTLEQIESTVTDEEKDIIRRKKDYIEGYYNVTVYSRQCPDEKSYLAFAVYDIKFKNEETMVPGLDTFYVKTSDDKNLCIYKGSDVEKDVEEFINEQIESETVKALFEDVDNRYVDALASSASLLEFVEGFNGDADLIEKAKEKAASASQAEAKKQEAEEKQETDDQAKENDDAAEQTQEPQEETQTQEPQQSADESTQTNENVLITATVNLRSGNDEGAERLTTMIVGDQATRTGITDNGWSKVQYSGMEGYVKSDYVTTFHITSDTVKPTTTINVRVEASETANMAGQVTPDMSLMRYAECDNGWSQVQFNGGVGYVKSEFLTQ